MEISFGDLVDRYSICLLKSERMPATEAGIVEFELIALKTEIIDKELWFYVPDLYKVNGEIWDLESDIRKGKENELGLEEVGRRAILIREKNKHRIELKNAINSKFNSGFIEYKANHASQ